MPIVFLFFVVIPVAEMWLLIEVGSRIGALPTIGLVLLTAVVGVALLRQQGFSTLMRARQKMETGQMPAQEMGEGIFLAIGGALLLTPGFITDVIGFSCLIPGLRHILMALILKRFRVVQMHSSYTQGETFEQYQQRHQQSSPSQTESKTLEGDFRRED